MRLLLDTHSFLWFISEDPKLSPRARQLIEDPANDVLLSMASVWEMAIKAGLGKLQFSQPFEVLVPAQIALNAVELLPITLDHLIGVSRLPFHHRDPFDRLIVAQALTEKIAVVGTDSHFDLYGIERYW